MPDYRVFFIDWDGHFFSAIDFQAASDQHAIARPRNCGRDTRSRCGRARGSGAGFLTRLLICRRWPRQGGRVASFSKPSTPLAAPGPDEVKDICVGQPQRHRRSAAC